MTTTSASCTPQLPARRRPLWALLALVLPGLLLWSGCQKTADFEDLDLLLGKEWRLVSLFDSQGNDLSQPCDLDDVLVFDSASKFSYHHGILDCHAEEQIQLRGDSWKMRDNFSEIVLKYKIVKSGLGGGSVTEYWKITVLDEATLVLEEVIDGARLPVIRTYQP